MCEHFRAEQEGATVAVQLRDGRWRYSTSYHCGDCGERFLESHVEGTLSHRIDEALAAVRRMREDAASHRVGRHG